MPPRSQADAGTTTADTGRTRHAAKQTTMQHVADPVPVRRPFAMLPPHGTSSRYEPFRPVAADRRGRTSARARDLKYLSRSAGQTSRGPFPGNGKLRDSTPHLRLTGIVMAVRDQCSVAALPKINRSARTAVVRARNGLHVVAVAARRVTCWPERCSCRLAMGNDDVFVTQRAGIRVRTSAPSFVSELGMDQRTRHTPSLMRTWRAFTGTPTQFHDEWNNNCDVTTCCHGKVLFQCPNVPSLKAQRACL